ncbi:MAG TPA: lysophospholipid acyltransferase family protein [Acidobacteriaceae bacterium]|nr:lysophospholipid acyltransferase family protein [Acidobacteriaceae bacterium]
MFSSITMLVTYILLALPAAAIGLPWTLISKDIGFLYRWSMWILGAGLKMGRIRIEVTGRERIPAGRACIFMSNHVSNLDPPILAPLFPFRTSFFLKRSLLKIPLLGWGMRLADFIPVDRDGRVESARASVEFAVRVLASGVHVSTFPEGTRSRTGELLPFKKGPFYLASESGAPVIPVSIWGTEHMMTKGSLRITPGTAHVIFHPPIHPETLATREELMLAVRSAIASGLPPAMRGADSPVEEL